MDSDHPDGIRPLPPTSTDDPRSGFPGPRHEEARHIGGLILPVVHAALVQALLITMGMEADEVVKYGK